MFLSPQTSTTSTNCSDESESSEEVATTTTTELENPPETETTTTEPQKTNSEETLVEETLPEQQETTKAEEPEATVSPGVFENGYDSMNPYLNPYATPVYYYPMQFYPVPREFFHHFFALNLLLMTFLSQQWVPIVPMSSTKARIRK